MRQVPNCFYRISVKGLILNEARDKFLITKEECGKWELPGGGLDWGTTPQKDLPREIAEEMGLTVTWVSERPSYFFTAQYAKTGTWTANVIYEARVDSLDFTPSDECVAVAFVSADTIAEYETFPNVALLAEMFDPTHH